MYPVFTNFVWDSINNNNNHTCHISQCEIKSHRIWPIWKPIPIRFFKSHRIFRSSYKTFYEEINKYHALLCLSQASYIQIKAFDYFGGLQSDFCKNLTEFYQSSIKNLLYLTDFSPQLMACMNNAGWFCSWQTFLGQILSMTLRHAMM